MRSKAVIGIVLIALGVVALAYRTFSYTKKTHSAKVLGLEVSLKEKETFEVPVWAGAGAVVIGTALLLAGRGK